MYPTFSVMYPANSIKGIINNEGSVVSICMSSSVEPGNTFSNSSDIGDTANPGRDVNAETDHIAKSAHNEMYAVPVKTLFICMIFNILVYILTLEHIF